jgi:hypothetical protein
MTEATLQKKCEVALRELGARCYHTYRSSRSEAGFPDLIAITPDGRLGAFELKRQSGKTTAAQEEWLGWFRRVRGATVAVIRPADYDWLVSWCAGELS